LIDLETGVTVATKDYETEQDASHHPSIESVNKSYISSVDVVYQAKLGSINWAYLSEFLNPDIPVLKIYHSKVKADLNRNSTATESEPHIVPNMLA
jgi:hypothetical protein